MCSAQIQEPMEKVPELKSLPSHLEYAFIDESKSHPVIISSKLSITQKNRLMGVLQKRKGVIA